MVGPGFVVLDRFGDLEANGPLPRRAFARSAKNLLLYLLLLPELLLERLEERLGERLEERLENV